MERKAVYSQTSIRGNDAVRTIPQEAMQRWLLFVSTRSIFIAPVLGTTSVVLSELYLVYQLPHLLFIIASLCAIHFGVNLSDKTFYHYYVIIVDKIKEYDKMIIKLERR